MNIHVFSLAVTVAGTFIGAGFVSGQELWQFFGAYGKSGIIGFLLAISLICILSAITLYYSHKAKKDTFDKVVCFRDSKLLRAALTVFQFVFYVGLYVIMTAGVESLASEYLEIHKIIVGAIFCLTVTVVTLKGVMGLMTVFSAVIPLLILSTMLIATAVLMNGTPELTGLGGANSLVSNWFVSALVFVSYNFFAAIGVFAGLGKHMTSKKQLICSSVLGCVFLVTLGLTILLSVISTGSEKYDMPMLNAANSLHPVIAAAYAILLLLAMFSAGISSLFPIVEWFRVYFPEKKRSAVVFSLSISAVTVVLSLFGFRDLIGTVYPIFGYFGFIIIISLIYSFAKEIRRNK